MDGKEIAGPYVRLACQRHLRDMEQGQKRSGIWWDLPAALNIFEFFEKVLTLSDGESVLPFSLHIAQKFILGSLFGWKSSDGHRRFRTAFIEMGKGNGKSPFGAGIAAFMLTADKELRAEVYMAAHDREQAKIPFRDLVAMVDNSPSLSSRIQQRGGKGNVHRLLYHQTDSFCAPISSEHTKGRGKSGPRPHFVLLDEVHEHPTDAMVEFMRAGTKTRRQALIMMITNSGVYDTTSVAWNYHEHSAKIVEQQSSEDSFFAYVCALDKGDDWKDPRPEIRKKANPLLGVSIKDKYLDEQVCGAIGMPSRQSKVRRLNFCEWVGSADPFVDPELWRGNGGAVDPALLQGRQCFGGLDLSSINDLASLTLAFPLDDGRMAILPYFWKAEGTLREHGDRDHADYQQWAADGFLLTTPGASIWYPFIAEKLGELSAQFDIRAVGFDPWRIKDFLRECDGIGATIVFVPHGQGFSGGDVTMTYSIAALEEELLNRRLLHGSHPVLEWCVSNAKVERDRAENKKFDKRKQTGRIDGAVSCAMAVGIAKSEKGPSEPQFFVLGGKHA